jgi:hypothetical protein
MTAKGRGAGLSKKTRHASRLKVREGMKRAARALSLQKLQEAANRAVPDNASMGMRAVLVVVLAPVLICFMSRKDVRRGPHRLRAGADAFEAWPSSGFDHSSDGRERVHPVMFARHDYSDPQAAGLIYARAMFFAGRYDSRPYWRSRRLEAGSPTDRATADLAIEHLIPCESMGRTINRVDTNGKMSYGILQFQDWSEWEAVSGLRGDPDNREDAIRMGEWAIENGMINHWTCAQILKISGE